jgi:hypothetical protein
MSKHDVLLFESLPFPSPTLPKIEDLHLNEEVIKGLRTPYVYAMPANKDPCSVGMLDHGLCHTILQVLFMWSILDYRYFESVQIGQRLAHPTDANALYHLLHDSQASGKNTAK